jgi:hypothetical protein
MSDPAAEPPEGPTKDAEQFDAAAWPDEFTPEIFRKIPVRDLIDIERHIDELSDGQRESFEASRADVWQPIAEKIRAASSASRTRWPRLSPLSPELEATMREIGTRMEDRRAAWGQLQSAAGRVRLQPWPAERGEAAAETVQESPAEFERELDRDRELLSVMTSMHDLMERQHLSSTRGAFFAIVVSMSVIAAGVAPIVTAASWSDRWWILGVSAVVGVVAVAIYWVVRWIQGHHGEKPGPKVE